MNHKIDIKKNPINVNITFSTIIKATIFFIFLFLIKELKDLILVFLTAIVLASSMEPFIKMMEKIKFPRLFSVSIVYVFLIAIIFWISILFIPALVEQINNFIRQIPVYMESLNTWLDGMIDNKTVMYTIVDETRNRIAGIFSNVSDVSIDGEVIKSNTKAFGGVIFGLFGGLLNFILVLVFSFYLAIQDHGIENFLKIITPVKYTKYALNLWKRTQKKISLWMQGQLALALIIGLITYLGLIIFFDFEHSLLLAVIAGLMELIPIIGPFLAAIPALVIALITGGWSLVGGIAIFYFSNTNDWKSNYLSSCCK